MKGKIRPWLWVLVPILLIAWLLPFGWNASMVPYSSLTPSDRGVSGIYRLLEERGEPVGRWEEGWDHLPETRGHVLWIVEPSQRFFSPGEIDTLKQWVRNGNTLIVWATFGRPLSDGLHLDGYEIDHRKKKVSMDRSGSGWKNEVETLHFPRNRRLLSSMDEVWKDDQGIPRIGKRGIGKGAIYYIPEPDLITNRGIGKEDNLALALYFASLAKGDGRIWFDETVHGMEAPSAGGAGEERTLTTLMSPLLWWLFFQGTLLFFLWLYRNGKRFGAPRWESVKEERTGNEYIRAMASLYQWAGVGQESLAIQLEGVLRETRSRLGLGSRSPLSKVLEQTERRMGWVAAQRFRKLIREIENLPDTPKGSTLIRLSRDLQKWREELEGWRPKRSTSRESGSFPTGF
ncbi:uncharacterized protein DUF4350 [Melghirimyces profundicolus]|uniref:Uncharacterized protein DUF4350 n=1 Tax=Melghirimyces profundicolus TaxID=1242148 RepID=A0A2T6BG82_9BACL|nr:DUF4350 domain-containing protein [Melghirimyces profundicolus]PTX55069.1 uncharacterized protein DUF4350 [Melghirimyces profundicolus]